MLPLLIAFEVGSAMYLARQDQGFVDTIRAHSILLAVFQNLGAVGRAIPAITIVVVLLIWHGIVRDPWRPRIGVVLGMAAESLLWVVPLLVLGILLRDHGPAAAFDGGRTLTSLPWHERVTLAIGAGIYEEVLFRLVLVTAIHFVVVDLLRFHTQAGSVVGLILSALAFAFYHDVSSVRGGVDIALITFYTLAGLFFGVIYLMRGLGIAVGAHAFYDILVLAIIGTR